MSSQATSNHFYSEQESLESLQEKITAAKQERECQRLKQELERIAEETSNIPSEYQGAMQVADTARVLHTKRTGWHLIELIQTRIIRMLSPRPIIGNLIGIGVTLLALFFLQHEVTLHHFGQYRHYIGVGLLVFAGLQIIKSSSRSLILPLLAMVIGAMVSHTLTPHQTLFTYGATFYQYVMIVGIIGLGIAAITID